MVEILKNPRDCDDMACYHPQTKFMKVMFSKVSVCPQGGVSAPLHAGIHPPRTRDRHPQDQRQTPRGPEVDIPPLARYPLGRYPPRQTPPWADTPRQTPPCQSMLGYGQQEGGTHPTGMHSCNWDVFTF